MRRRSCDYWYDLRCCAFPLYHHLALTYVLTKTVRFIDALEAERQGNEQNTAKEEVHDNM
jgi:hypothetical protein